MITESEIKALLSKHGETRQQFPSDWKGPFPLPHAVESFYESIGPVNVTIEGYGNPYFLPSLGELWNFQAGYRYDPKSGKDFDDWNRNWLVVAGEAGDPFIFESGTGRVLHALHGQGIWEPMEIFPNLVSMAGSLASLGRVVMEAGPDLIDEDANIKHKHLEETRKQLEMVLEPAGTADSVLEMLGWK